LALSTCKSKIAKMVVPIGLEKLIPISVAEAPTEGCKKKPGYSMGMPVELLPIMGLVVTELDAISFNRCFSYQ
jgi:hypothetical protein